MANSMSDKQHTPNAIDSDQILYAALDLAQKQDNWYDLSLVELADYCGIPLTTLHSYFPDTNAIADAWFSQALELMISPDFADLDNLPTTTRLEHIIWRWFEALAPYHKVTAQMLKAKLHLPHIHHWVPMVFDLSNLIQLWRDMAGLHAGGRKRQIQEIALTGIFLITLSAWCRDSSARQTNAHSKLVKLLQKAERSGQF